MAMMMKPATTNAIMNYDLYTPTEEERDRDISLFKDVYDENNLGYTDGGINKILDLYYKNNTPIINLLSKHPNWDAKNRCIRLDAKLNLQVDKAIIRKFWQWVQEYLYETVREAEILAPNQYTETPLIEYEVNNILDQMLGYNLPHHINWSNYDYLEIVNREPESVFLVHYFDSIIDWYKENTSAYSYNANLRRVHLSYENVDKFSKWFSTLEILRNKFGQFTSADTVEEVNDVMPELKPIEGQKFSKLVRRFCQVIGIDKVKDIQPVARYGGGVEEKDFGYNYQIALMGDALNPIKVPRPTFISVHEIDFLTMSEGYEWDSCHRLSNWDGRDRGCNCSGTLSYMLDGVSFIFYNLVQHGNAEKGWDSETEIENPFFERKFNRCVCQYKDGKLIMGRVYPQKNDSENGLRDEVRAIVQKIIADCLDLPNFWSVKIGADEVRKYEITIGTHYVDYHYDYSGAKQSSISFLKAICESKTDEELRNEKSDFVIGHYPICAYCGSEHSDQSSPNCCHDHGSYDYYCERCGDGIDVEYGDYIYVEGYDSHYYCCSSCAEGDGYHEVFEWTGRWGWCQDGRWMHQEDIEVYCDDYNGEYFYDQYLEDGIHTEDGNHYMDSESAVGDGYVKTEDGYWYPEDECVEVTNPRWGDIEWQLKSDCTQCPECGEWVLNEDFDFEHDVCMSCWSNREEEEEDDDDLVDITEDEEVVDELPWIA